MLIEPAPGIGALARPAGGVGGLGAEWHRPQFEGGDLPGGAPHAWAFPTALQAALQRQLEIIG